MMMMTRRAQRMKLKTLVKLGCIYQIVCFAADFHRYDMQPAFIEKASTAWWQEEEPSEEKPSIPPTPDPANNNNNNTTSVPAHTEGSEFLSFEVQDEVTEHHYLERTLVCECIFCIYLSLDAQQCH